MYVDDSIHSPGSFNGSFSTSFHVKVKCYHSIHNLIVLNLVDSILVTGLVHSQFIILVWAYVVVLTCNTRVSFCIE